MDKPISSIIHTKPNFETNDIIEMRLLVIIAYSLNENPDEINNYAMSKFKYGSDTSFGVRSIGLINDEQTTFFNALFQCLNKTIFIYNSFFLFINKFKQTYVHIDDTRDSSYAAVCYLNNKPLKQSGLILYDETSVSDKFGSLFQDNHLSRQHISQWYRINKMDIDSYICEEYNKVILYKTNTYHYIYQPYGETKMNCRLGHTFFFDTINK
jgi:hypothetical protein